jgi:hypothetical protein
MEIRGTSKEYVHETDVIVIVHADFAGEKGVSQTKNGPYRAHSSASYKTFWSGETQMQIPGKHGRTQYW